MVDSQKPYVLGLDLGVQSVGWAMLGMDEDGQACNILRSGVRCFDSGVGSETEIASGKDESQNVKRRQMRLQRRQLWRRGRRLKKIFLVLQKAGLLPPGETRTPEQRHELLKKLDAELAKTFLPDHDRVAGHLLPYRLRSLALDERCRRSRLAGHCSIWPSGEDFQQPPTAAKGGKETGPVKKASVSCKKIEETGARTLGEYFAVRSRGTAYPPTLDCQKNVP